MRFAWQYYNPETVIHSNTLCYYDPSSGRFIQQNPIGLVEINLYQYVLIYLLGLILMDWDHVMRNSNDLINR
ncbi:RHS repeat-associated core domain-containing protein [Gilliamella apicola]|uniref:RHS repeat-associated core domain-containing protein n=1 Tax=Gilliamella apicola TaxID=1196095 RepID=A0A2C9XWN3_9GAMM|nr:hypothetical protein B5S40_06880 [Gilliamella apicola]OTP84858.1 hypothetical protein B5S44_08290 [Gilliamella apicola]OTP87063.1 hypothetical protein B5S42_11540 [Gilliamella apicola]OTP97814.1 hypothetical protein B6D08_13315 [Gilliamella apicola]OTQ07560.1 hypothetical protein B6C87_13030 [Gilliamella apicola]